MALGHISLKISMRSPKLIKSDPIDSENQGQISTKLNKDMHYGSILAHNILYRMCLSPKGISPRTYEYVHVLQDSFEASFSLTKGLLVIVDINSQSI